MRLLFFDVGAADGGRGGGASDGAGQNKDGQHIGDHIDKLRRHHLGQVGLERFAESEQKPGPEETLSLLSLNPQFKDRILT